MSDSQTAEGSTPEVTNAETPEVQGGNPWLKMVPKDTAEKYSEVLNGFDSFNNFVEGSVTSMNDLKEIKEKYDGRTVAPKEGSDPGDWDKFWASMGKPSEVSEYGVEEEALAKLYHNANLTREQAETLTKGLLGYTEEQGTEYETQKKADYEKATAQIREKYGDRLDVVMRTAKTALNNLGGPKVVELFQSKGIDNDPAMIEFFINVGTLMQEGNIPVGHKLKPKAEGLQGTYNTMEGID